MFYILNLNDIGEAISQGLRTLMGRILALLYTLIEDLYAVFIYLSKAEILDETFIKEIYFKVGLILGLFMLFKLSFSLIQMLIDPDKISDEESGFASIIKRSIIAIVLLGITPSLFRAAFSFQNLIVGSENKNNIIYKFISNKNASGNFSDLGRALASDLYFTFFTDDKEPFLDLGSSDLYDPTVGDGEYYNRMPEDNYDNLVKAVRDPENDITFDDAVDYLAIKGNGTNKWVIEFNWFLSLVMAIAVIWMFFNYCLQVAIRVIQLAYLQLISPIPILSYISDPDGTFKNWLKQCSTTFLDLFFRLSIIYFVMTIMEDVLEQFQSASGIIFESTGLPTDRNGMFIVLKIFIIVGLLLFAKKVPDLFKELFPGLGNSSAGFDFGLKKPKELVSSIPLVGPAIGWGSGKLGQFGKWAAKKATAPAVKKYHNWKDDIKGRREVRELENPGKRLFNRYGDDIENAFSKEFADSYMGVKNAKAAARDADIAFQALRQSGASEERIKEAYNNKINAEKALKAAESRHEINRKKYGADARKESAYEYYKKMSRPSKSQWSDSQSSRSQSPRLQSSSPQVQSSQSTSSQSTQLSKEKLQHFAEIADKRPSHFTDEERPAEATRREQARSSDNNEHQAEIASSSIFGDNDAMRQSDAEHNRKNNVDTRTYDNDNPYGE